MRQYGINRGELIGLQTILTKAYDICYLIPKGDFCYVLRSSINTNLAMSGKREIFVGGLEPRRRTLSINSFNIFEMSYLFEDSW